MSGYKGALVSIVEMIDELVRNGRNPFDAGQELRHAIEDGAIPLAEFGDGKRLLADVVADIERLASALAALHRGERPPPSETMWPQHNLKNIRALRERFEEACGLRQSAPLEPQRPSKRGRREDFHWDLIETEFIRLMDHHGDFDSGDVDWNAQARAEEALKEFCQQKWRKEPGTTQLREHIRTWLAAWRKKKTK